MSTRIAGMGWVTPLGADLESVWQCVSHGDVPEAKSVANPESGRAHTFFAVPPKLIEHLGRNPRLRRSSAISYFAVAAGLAALENAGLQPITPEIAARTAVVFGATDGSVVYTRKFYEQIAKQGANAASPLLFPETVYNAPASHLAAQLGIDGASYTLVGDSSVGFAALKFGEQLLALGEADHVVVVGCEELDWILCEAYADWRLARTPLAEGAGAVVLTRDTGRFDLEVHGGEPFFRQRDAADALSRALCSLVKEESTDVLISCASQTFLGSAEARALAGCAPASQARMIFTPKRHFGEMLGASGLVHVIFAALALEHENQPRALVPLMGFNQQADAAIVSCA